MLEAREDHIVGRIVGPYRVLSRLGPEGEMPLFVTEHLHLDRQVALRLIGHEIGWISGGLDRFLTEARKLSRVRHRNVLQLVDLGETGDGHVYLAMELPRGQRLDRIIAGQGALSGVRARNIARQIGLALSAAAQAGLENRDVDARQVFLTTDGDRGDFAQVDFATADMLAAEPEAVPDGAQTLGRLLYTMLCGRPPVAAPGKAPPDPGLARPDLDLPADLTALTMRALDPDPARRWPDLDAMMRALTGGGRKTSRFEPAVADPRHHRFEHSAWADRSRSERPSWRASLRTVVAAGVVAALALILVVTGWLAQTGRLPLRRARQALTSGIQAPLVVPRSEAPAVAAAPATRWNPAGAEVPLAQASWAGANPADTGAASAGSGAGFAPVMNPSSAPAGFTVEPLPATIARGGRSGLALGTAGPGPVRPRPGATAPGAPGGPREAATGTPPARQAALAVARETAAPAVPGTRRLDQGGGQDAALGLAAGHSAGGDDACLVTLGSKPWSAVWIDGRQAGFTPLVDYAVDCGAHQVTFKIPEAGIEKRIPVYVQSGQPFRRFQDMGVKDPRILARGAAPPGQAPTAGPAAAAAAAAACLVTLGSRPSSEVWLDGKQVGTTPIVDLAIACGKHDLLFRSSEPEEERHEPIVVLRGRPLKKVVYFTQEAEPK